ncbi:hypothetical protein HDU78_011711 [Chytriomyces hyalinus]|nr:hypothetical protein HDU78_011711 [Chytriomyces hyalinus]
METQENDELLKRVKQLEAQVERKRLLQRLSELETELNEEPAEMDANAPSSDKLVNRKDSHSAIGAQSSATRESPNGLKRSHSSLQTSSLSSSANTSLDSKLELRKQSHSAQLNSNKKSSTSHRQAVVPKAKPSKPALEASGIIKPKTQSWEDAPAIKPEIGALSFMERFKMHQQKEEEEILRTSHFRDRAHGKQQTSKPRFSDFNDPAIECFSGIRIKDRCVQNNDFGTLMQGRSYLPLSVLTPDVTDSDINGDWVTIGVLVDRSEPRVASNKKKYIVFKLSDLNGHVVNALLFGNVFETHWKEMVGGVFAVLNPRILPVTEKSSMVGLDIDDEGKFLKLGASMDQVKCKFMSKGTDPKGCFSIIDGRKNKYCTYHIEMLFKKAKHARSEFTASTSSNRVGSPTKPKPGNPLAARHGSYLHADGIVISTLQSKGSLFSRVDSQGRVSIPSELSEEAKRDMSRGAKYVRMARGMAKPVDPNEVPNVFSQEALKRLGFDPITGKDVIIAAPTAEDDEIVLPSVLPSKINERMILECVKSGTAIPTHAIGSEEIEIDI